MKQLFCNGQNDRLLAEFLKQGVRFIVVGGLAVHFHVPEREADDLDLLVESTPDNAAHLSCALLNLRDQSFDTNLITKPHEQPQHFPMKRVFYADLVTTGTDIDFATEWERADEGLIFQNKVRFASKDLLIRMKRKGGREKDLSDIALLESIP